MSKNVTELLTRANASFRFRSRRFLFNNVIWPAPLWIVKGKASFDIGEHHLTMDGPTREVLQRMRRGTYEAGLGEIMADLVKPGDVFLDIGAHIGLYTLVAAATVGNRGRVVAFEPDPVALEYLKRNVQLNGLTNTLVVEAAVSDEDGNAQITARRFGLSGTTLGHREGDAAGSQVVIPTVRLDTYCNEHDLTPDVVKVDTEGGEVNVLKSAFEILQKARVVFFEFHPVKIKSDFDGDPDAIYARIKEIGKRVQVIEESGETATLRDVGPDERFEKTTRLILT